MRHSIYALFIVCLLLSSCDRYDQKVSIFDVTKTEVLILKSDKKGKVISLKVLGDGVLRGKAHLSLMLNGKPYKTEMLTGNIKFEWGGDWYADSATIIYSPVNVNAGNLSLRYRFKTL